MRAILTICMSATVTKWRKRPGFIRDIHESSAPASIGICMARWNGRLEVWSRGVDGAEVLERLSLVSIADQSRQPCVYTCCRHTQDNPNAIDLRRDLIPLHHDWG